MPGLDFTRRRQLVVPQWRNGRRRALKTLCPKGRVGSNPSCGTRVMRHGPCTEGTPMARSSALARVPLIGETHAPVGAAVNILLRIAILVMSVDAIVNSSDQRFAGKALAPRDVIISFGFAMLFPLFWKLRHRKRE